MKKLLCLVLTLALVFCFAGCGEAKKEEKEGTLDIEYYTKAGQMPECSYSLGNDVETVKTELSKKAEESESVYNVTEGENNVLIEGGDFSFYYKKAEPEKGITCIVNYGKAYGFEIGTVISEIKEAIKGCEYVEEAADEKNAFFMFSTIDSNVIKCTAGGNTVVFVFKDDALLATALFA